MAGSTRSDVARLAGVSPAVVSYVVNGGPRPVSQAARERVEAAIETLGYRPSALANAFRQGRTKSVGLLIPAQVNPFYAELAVAIDAELQLSGYTTSMAVSSFNSERDSLHLRSFIDRRVDGIIIAAGASLPAGVSDIGATPHVILDNGARGSPAQPHAHWCVRTDDDHDVARAVDHLKLHGHHLIGCIAGPPTWSVNANRVAVWRSELRRDKLIADDDLLAHADITEQGGAAALKSLMAEDSYRRSRRSRLPTAIFVGSDVQAIGALRSCFELGIRVPDDVALVSFDGVATASYSQPSLTTMRQPTGEIVRTAAQLLIEQIENPQQGDHPAELTLRGNLVIGESCGCVTSRHPA